MSRNIRRVRRNIDSYIPANSALNYGIEAEGYMIRRIPKVTRCKTKCISNPTLAQRVACLEGEVANINVALAEQLADINNHDQRICRIEQSIAPVLPPTCIPTCDQPCGPCVAPCGPCGVPPPCFPCGPGPCDVPFYSPFAFGGLGCGPCGPCGPGGFPCGPGGFPCGPGPFPGGPGPFPGEQCGGRSRKKSKKNNRNVGNNSSSDSDCQCSDSSDCQCSDSSDCQCNKPAKKKRTLDKNGDSQLTNLISILIQEKTKDKQDICELKELIRGMECKPTCVCEPVQMKCVGHAECKVDVESDVCPVTRWDLKLANKCMNAQNECKCKSRCEDNPCALNEPSTLNEPIQINISCCNGECCNYLTGYDIPVKYDTENVENTDGYTLNIDYQNYGLDGSPVNSDVNSTINSTINSTLNSTLNTPINSEFVTSDNYPYNYFYDPNEYFFIINNSALNSPDTYSEQIVEISSESPENIYSTNLHADISDENMHGDAVCDICGEPTCKSCQIRDKVKEYFADQLEERLEKQFELLNKKLDEAFSEPSSESFNEQFSQPNKHDICTAITLYKQPNSQPIWSSKISGSGPFLSMDITTDSKLNIIAIGGFQNQISINNSNGTISQEILSDGSTDTYVIKYDDNGFVIWAAKIGGVMAEMPSRVVTDRDDNIIVVGAFTSNPLNVYDSSNQLVKTLNSTGTIASFIVKYNTHGSVIFATSIINLAIVSIKSVQTDVLNNIYIVGTFNDSGTTSFLNTDSSVGATLGPSTGNSIFIAKYSQTGVAMWATKMINASSTEISNDLGLGISISPDGTVNISGQYNSNILAIYSAPDGTIDSGLSLVSGAIDNFESNAFLAKYSSMGIAIWATRVTSVGGFNISSGSNITDTCGNIYITGTYSADYDVIIYNAPNGTYTSGLQLSSGTNNAFIIKYDALGSAIWVVKLTGNLIFSSNTISRSCGPNLIITGNFQDQNLSTFNFDGSSGPTLVNTGTESAFIMKLTSDGIIEWLTKQSNLNYAISTAVNVDKCNNILATGSFIGQQIDFYNSNGLIGAIMANSDEAAIYIVKYSNQ